ncbi:hypothetical protein ABIF50_002235 [Bradyrhizobium diazoefficiens]
MVAKEAFKEPWRYSAAGISIALRVTPRGGRDDIDGIEQLADGRSVLKVRVRAIADGGEANKAVLGEIAWCPQGQRKTPVRSNLAAEADRGRRRSGAARRDLAPTRIRQIERPRELT